MKAVIESLLSYFYDSMTSSKFSKQLEGWFMLGFTLTLILTTCVSVVGFLVEPNFDDLEIVRILGISAMFGYGILLGTTVLIKILESFE